MMVQLDDQTFCSDICLNMMCGALPCDQAICESQCNTSLYAKMNVYDKWDSSSSESSEEYQEMEEYQQTADMKPERHHHGRHHGGHHRGHHGAKGRRHFRNIFH